MNTHPTPRVRSPWRLRPFLAALSLAIVPAAFAAPPPTMFGANIAGAEFYVTGDYPGDIDQQYWYPRADDIDQAKAAGIELVRIPFKWDRIHHDVEGVLPNTFWAEDITALDASLNAIEARGMRIILDMHNYGERSLTVGGVRTVHKIGSAQLPKEEFAKIWRMLAARYGNRPSLWGYDLMNEPLGITTETWVECLQAAVNAIREVDMKTPIILQPTGTYSDAARWMQNGPQLLAVTDPANNLVYSAHCYTDRDKAGHWDLGKSVANELVGPGKPYSTLEAALWVGRDRVKPFVDWCVANNVRGLVGEYGSPAKTDQTNWDIVTDRMLSYIKNDGNGLVSATQWAHGGISLDSETRMQVRQDNSSPSLPLTILPNYVSGVGTNYWPRFTIYNNAIAVSADYSLAYSFPSSVTINVANTVGSFSDKSIKVSYTLPSGTSGGGGLHIRGPFTAGAVGGIDLTRALQAGHVLSFYAKTNTAGATVSVTLGKTTNSSGIDTGSDTGTGTWVSLNGGAHGNPVLGTTWQRFQIPLTALLSANVDGTGRVQRFRFNLGSSNGTAREVYFDNITIGVHTSNTPPNVSVDTSPSGSTFAAGANVTLVSNATDSNAGDSIDYVEFYANGVKVGLDDTVPYQVTTSFPAAGSYAVTAIAYDSRGISKQSTVKTLTITASAPATPTGLAAITGNARAILDWNNVSGATSYHVKRATASGGPYATVASPTASDWIDTGLTNGTTYYYVVSAVNSGGPSGDSAQVSVAPQAITITIDNPAATRLPTNGSWQTSTASPGFLGGDYLHDLKTGATGGRSVRFTPTITVAGYYEAFARWPADPNRATNTPIDVNHAGGTASATHDQTAAVNNNTWVPLGIYFFNAGTAGNVTIRNDGANGFVVADGVQFILR